MTGRDFSETMASVREAQNIVATCVATWLRAPTDSAEERLAAARRQEADLFRLLGHDQPGKPHTSNAAMGLGRGRVRGRPPSKRDNTDTISR
jgi:hypothetical protein